LGAGVYSWYLGITRAISVSRGADGDRGYAVAFGSPLNENRSVRSWLEKKLSFHEPFLRRAPLTF
jgi:hypothetical protein